MNIESTAFRRLIQKKLQATLEKRKSFLLLGPRQTGKTTILEEIFASFPEKQKLKFYFQLPTERETIEADPEKILRVVEAQSTTKPIFLLIDEIQKIPKIMDILQFLIDKKKIILAASGSSARKMRTLGTNWLPGRIHLEHLYPLTWEEAGLLDNSSRLSQYLLYGFLPGILSQKESRSMEEDLRAYTHLYLEEEIRAEAVVRNLPRFTKFLRLTALESGSHPNYSKIGSQVELSHTMVREYFQILEDSLLIHQIPAFGSSRDQVLRSPRYYFFDMGVRNAAAQIGHHEGILKLQMGVLFEHFIVLELLAQLKHKFQFSCWRTKKGEEVDLILEKGAKKIAIEIKATAKPTEEDFKHLKTFSKKYAPAQTLLVCQVSRPEKFGQALAIPWQKLHEHLDI